MQFNNITGRSSNNSHCIHSWVEKVNLLPAGNPALFWLHHDDCSAEVCARALIEKFSVAFVVQKIFTVFTSIFQELVKCLNQRADHARPHVPVRIRQIGHHRDNNDRRDKQKICCKIKICLANAPMGIAGLLPALKEVQKPVHLSELEPGTVVAVDTYRWLHRSTFYVAEQP